MVGRILRILLLACVLSACLSVSVAAEDTLDCADEYKEMLEVLPDDIAELLPDELFSDKISDINKGAEKVLSFKYLLGIFAKYVGFEAKNVIKLFAVMLGILILSSIINSVKSSFSSDGISSTFSLISTGAIILIAFSSGYSVISSVTAFFSRLGIFASSLLPLTAVLYAMGGNVASAVAHHSSLMIFIQMVEALCTRSAMPIASVCMAFASVNAVSPDLNLGELTGFFKKSYTQVLALLMTVFMTVMGAQSLLAGKADTISGKAAKLAIGNLIPTVGGALSGSLGTVAASVEYIRASVGAIGIVIIILMLFPTLMTLILTKLAFGMLSGAAEILGCEREKRIISELASINGFLLALAAICSVCMIFIITLFVKCSSAAGGGVI